MRKLLLFLSVFTLMSCVDQDFDLSKVDDSDIVIGDEFVAPIGSVTIKYSEIAEFVPNRAATLNFTIPESFNVSYPLNSGFDQGIIDQIGEKGTQSVGISVNYQLPDLRLNLKLSFDESGIIYEGDAKNEIKIDISKELLEKIAKSKKITVEFFATGKRDVSVDLDSNAIVVNLVLYRKGGIKL